jgi:hypothetical protein
MVEPGQDQGLAAEAVAGDLVVEGARGQHLDGDIAIEMLVVRAVDHAHAALTQGLDDDEMGETASDHEVTL